MDIATQPLRHPSSRLFVLTTIGLVLVTLAAAVVSILQLRLQALTAAEDDTQRLSLILSEHAARTVQGVDTVLQELVERIARDGIADREGFAALMRSAEMRAFLVGRQARRVEADAFSIVDANGDLLNWSRDIEPPAFNLSDRDHFVHFRDSDDQGVFVGTPNRNHVTGRWTLFLARRARGPNGEFLGLFIAVLTLDYFVDFYRDITASDGRAIGLFRSDGTVLARYPEDPAMIGRNIAGTSPVLQALGAGAPISNHWMTGNFDGLRRFVSGRRMRNYPIVVSAAVSEAAALAAWRGGALVIATGALAALSGIGLLFVLVRRQVSLLSRSERALQSQVVDLRDAQARLEAQGAALALAMQDAANARDAADRANRSKSDFLANMSHEIRTPINGVLGNLDLLRDSALSAEQRRFADDARESGRILLHLVNDILDLSKLEAGRMTLEAIDFDLERTLDTAVRVLRPKANEKGIALTLDVAENARLALRGDPSRLRQIVINLVGNAVKFTERGAVTVRAEAQGRDGSATAIAISVSDTGIGMSGAARERLFLKFSQADESTPRRFGGTGLGLAISRQLVELMGGEIGVESEPGRGSTFRFVLRLCDAAGGPHAERATDLSPPATLQRPCRVLLAEDNAINQRIAVALLERAGHRVDHAANGREAVRMALAGGYDVILMDIQMPELDGVAATALIREAERGTKRRVPIVALTAHAMQGVREEYLAAGMDDYVGKPFDNARLLRTVERWAGGPAHPEPPARVHSIADAITDFDDAQLAMLEPALPVADFRGLIDSFLAGNEARLRGLQAALAANDLPALGREAHDLVGTAGNFGAKRLQDLARQLAAACRAAAPDDAGRIVTEIGHAADDVRRAIHARFLAGTAIPA
ncbi:MAG: response regulator [Alphaproteobacteria bacterium]|nr:response regulator [Alphaproteobacteria bacterium]